MALEEKDLQAFASLVNEKILSIKKDVNNGFKTVNLKLDVQKKTSDRIEVQARLTNGRVTDLEKVVENIKLDEVKHIINCPQIEEIEDLREELNIKKADSDKKIAQIHDDLLEYKMLKKYPKIGLGVVAVTCIILVVSVFLTLSELKKEIRTYYHNEIVRPDINN